jgi:hypothetical protein
MRKTTSMKKPRANAVYEELKRKLLELGLVRPGSLVRRFMPCGRQSCRCMTEPPALHGPYYQWTHKIRGKTITMRLTETQARLCAEWVGNHRELKRIIRKMETLSLKETDRLLRKAT